MVVGRIGRAHGLRGEVRVDLEGPGDALRRARRVFVGDPGRRMRVETLRGHSARLLLKLEGVDDPDAARALTGQWIRLRRSDFPPTGEDEYYWTDLIGARVRVHGQRRADLGVIEEVVATPAYDVLVVRGPGGAGEERLIPFTRESLHEVRIAEGLVLVNAPGDESAGPEDAAPPPRRARKSREHATPRVRRGPKKN